MDFTERIIENWLRVVKRDDLVLHLGDFAFASAKKTAALICELPGQIVLVRGNHDHRPAWWLRHGLLLCVDEIKMGDILFTHEPRTPLPDWCRLNVHGHLHSNSHRLAELSSYFFENRERYKTVSIEDELAPIPWGEILG
jgi:calcineurin-like phosphoesterase family protein